MKKVLFVCGSPRGEKSASGYTARFLASLLHYQISFIDVARMDDAAYVNVRSAIAEADMVIWVFGAWVLSFPVQMQRLFDRFASEGFRVKGGYAATVLTSVRVGDDSILDRMRSLSELFGFEYVGDVSAEGNPYFGYSNDADAEGECRLLARKIEAALDRSPVAPSWVPANHSWYSPDNRGVAFPVIPSSTLHEGVKVVLLTGFAVKQNPFSAAMHQSLCAVFPSSVTLVELEPSVLKPCSGCFLCNFRKEGVCPIQDDYYSIIDKLLQADFIVMHGVSATGGVDQFLKTFLDRSWGLLHRPVMQGRYGLAVVSGGGPLGRPSARYLGDCMRKLGITVTAEMEEAEDAGDTAAILSRLIDEMIVARRNKAVYPKRFGLLSVERALADMIHANGMALKADYAYYRRHRLFPDYSTGGSFVIRILFKHEGIARKLIAFRRRQLEKERTIRRSAM